MFGKVCFLLAVCGCACAQDWTEQAVLSLFDQESPMRREAQAAGAAAVEAVRGRTLWPNPIAVYSRETSGFTEFVMGEQQFQAPATALRATGAGACACLGPGRRSGAHLGYTLVTARGVLSSLSSAGTGDGDPRGPDADRYRSRFTARARAGR